MCLRHKLILSNGSTSSCRPWSCSSSLWYKEAQQQTRYQVSTSLYRNERLAIKNISTIPGERSNKLTIRATLVQAHEDRNLANKLTPDERREKKIEKLVGAAKEGEATPVSVFKVTNLESGQHRFKVKVNAEVKPFPLPPYYLGQFSSQQWCLSSVSDDWCCLTIQVAKRRWSKISSSKWRSPANTVIHVDFTRSCHYGHTK